MLPFDAESSHPQAVSGGMSGVSDFLMKKSRSSNRSKSNGPYGSQHTYPAANAGAKTIPKISLTSRKSTTRLSEIHKVSCRSCVAKWRLGTESSFSKPVVLESCYRCRYCCKKSTYRHIYHTGSLLLLFDKDSYDCIKKDCQETKFEGVNLHLNSGEK
jgi:hypothetical protein